MTIGSRRVRREFSSLSSTLVVSHLVFCGPQQNGAWPWRRSAVCWPCLRRLGRFRNTPKYQSQEVSRPCSKLPRLKSKRAELRPILNPALRLILTPALGSMFSPWRQKLPAKQPKLPTSQRLWFPLRYVKSFVVKHPKHQNVLTSQRLKCLSRYRVHLNKRHKSSTGLTMVNESAVTSVFAAIEPARVYVGLLAVRRQPEFSCNLPSATMLALFSSPLL